MYGKDDLKKNKKRREKKTGSRKTNTRNIFTRHFFSFLLFFLLAVIYSFPSRIVYPYCVWTNGMIREMFLEGME